MSKQISIRVIRSILEIEDIRDIWSSWQYHPNADIDLYLTYLISSRASFEFVRPHIVVVYRNGRPDAMLVGRIEHRRIDCNIGYKTLFRPQARVLNFNFGGLLGNLSADISEVLVESIMDFLHHGEADVAAFNYLRVDSPLYGTTTRLPCWLSRDCRPTLRPHRSTTLPGNIDEIYRGMSKARTSEIRRKAKKFLAEFDGDIRIDSFTGPTDLDKMIRDAEEVARKTYQRALGVGFVDDTAIRQRLCLEVEKGWLRGYVLYLKDRPCAFWIASLYRGTFYGGYTGYDRAYGRYSPGMFLMMRVIEDLCNTDGNAKILRIDWGLGDAEYKEALSDCEWQEASIHIFAPTLKGFWLKILSDLTTLTDRALRRPLEKAKFVPKIKKVWRNRLVKRQKDAPPRGVIEREYEQ